MHRGFVGGGVYLGLNTKFYECFLPPQPSSVMACAENCRELPEIEIVQDVFEFLFHLEEPETVDEEHKAYVSWSRRNGPDIRQFFGQRSGN